MSEQTNWSASHQASLPERANLEWLRKEAKRRLLELNASNPDAKLADAQFTLAKSYGFASWRALKAHVDTLAVEGQAIEAARGGDAAALRTLLDARAALIRTRIKPYAWTLLHLAAQHGKIAVVDLLLERGLLVDTREEGDNTTPLFWAAAGGHLDVVRRLVAAGADVSATGDDHELGVIGWATSWEGGDDEAHRATADFLIARGARHHIFSAIALGLADEVRRIVTHDPTEVHRRMSQFENRQTTLQFAVRMNRLEMVRLLLELGADPTALDGEGMPTAVYAQSPDSDRLVMEAIRARSDAASRAHDDRARGQTLLATVALGDWDATKRLVADDPNLIRASGALHIMAKRGDLDAVRWLLDRGAEPNALWGHWDAELTAMHLAAWQGHAEIVRVLLDSGGDPAIRDSKHDGDVAGWAEHGGHPEIVALIAAH